MFSAWPFRLKSSKTKLLCILLPDFFSSRWLLAVFPWHKYQKENISAYCILKTSQNQLPFTIYILLQGVNITAEKYFWYAKKIQPSKAKAKNLNISGAHPAFYQKQGSEQGTLYRLLTQSLEGGEGLS